MYYGENQRNGIIGEDYRWKNATIPFYIQEDQFSDEEIETILLAVREFHQKSCLRFKPYELSDENWIFITGSEQGLHR